jgi:hypothetical protein
MSKFKQEEAMKNVSCCAIIIFLLWGNLGAQTADTVWSRIHSISPNGDIDEGKCVRQTQDGGFIITGSCVPQGMTSHVDVLLLKSDMWGNIQWTKTYGKGFFEEGLAVAQTADEGYIIGGRWVSGSYPIIDPVYSDAWLLKTDANGDTLWTKTYGGSGNDYCTSIQQTPDMGYIMTGTSNAEYPYPNYEINEEYQPDSARAWLLKTNAEGETLWEKTYFLRSHTNCVDQTADGGYIMVGWIFPGEQDNRSDVLLIKTNAFGDTLWTKKIGGEDYEAGFYVRETSDGYVIVGQTKPLGSRYDALLIKTDLSGEVVWSKIIGGEKNDMGFSVEVTSDGGFFITGVTNGNWWAHQGDMWGVKTDPEGNVMWELVYDFAVSDFAWSGIPTSDDRYVMTGLIGYGFGGDLWLAKLTEVPAGIEEKSSRISDYILRQNYPNPFNPSTTIRFHLPKSGEVSLKIFNNLGEEVETLVSNTLPAGAHRYVFEAGHLASGIYLYRLQTGDYLESRKMILMK